MRISVPPSPSLAKPGHPLGEHRREVGGAFRGTRERASEGTTAVVVGGGLAGTAAAFALAERGVHVTLLEQRSTLGGRLSGKQLTTEHGTQYTFGRIFGPVYRNHYNVRRWLSRIDPSLSVLRELPGTPAVMREGPHGCEQISYANLPPTLPFNLLTLLRRTSFLNLSELRKGVSSERARALLAFDANSDYAKFDVESAGSFLGSLGLPSNAEELLMTVFALSGAEARSDLSAAEFLTRLHFHFLSNPEGIRADVIEDPANDVVWAPVARALESQGVVLRLKTGTENLTLADGKVRVVDGHGGVWLADGVVLAIDGAALEGIVQRSPDLAGESQFADSVRQIGNAPYEIVYRAFTRHAAGSERLPYVHVTGTRIRTLELLERVENESRRLAMRTGGSVVQVVAYSNEAPSEEMKRDIRHAIDRVYPELAISVPGNVLEEAWLAERVLPRFTPGSGMTRPRVATPFGTITLAGDYLRLPFPTHGIERAAASGTLAANLLLDRWDVRGEPVYRIGARGFLGAMRWMASGQ